MTVASEKHMRKNCVSFPISLCTGY